MRTLATLALTVIVLVAAVLTTVSGEARADGGPTPDPCVGYDWCD